MATELTRIGSLILVNSKDFRIARFQLIKNRNVVGIHRMTFLIEVEARRVYGDEAKEETKEKG